MSKEGLVTKLKVIVKFMYLTLVWLWCSVVWSKTSLDNYREVVFRHASL